MAVTDHPLTSTIKTEPGWSLSQIALFLKRVHLGYIVMNASKRLNCWRCCLTGGRHIHDKIRFICSMLKLNYKVSIRLKMALLQQNYSEIPLLPYVSVLVKSFTLDVFFY